MNKGLAFKHLIYVLLCSTFFAIITTCVQLYIDYKKDVTEVTGELAKIERSFIPPLISSRYNLDKEQLGLLLKSIERLRDIEYVALRENKANGSEILASAGEPKAEGQLKKQFPLIYERNGRRINLGILQVQASLESAYSRLMDRLLVIIASNTFKTFLMSFVILLIVHALTVRHLKKIAGFTGNLDGESLDRTLSLDKKGRRDELDEIVDAINAMILRIKSDIERINEAIRTKQTLNKELEDKNEALRAEVARRKQTEKMLRENEAELRKSRDLLDATQKLARIGGWEWDTAQQTMQWTEEMYRIHGITPSESDLDSVGLIERSLACYDPNDRPIIEEAFRQCLEQGHPYSFEMPLTKIDGSRIWILSTAQPVMEGNVVVKAVGNIIDITKHKQAEKEQEKLQAQLLQAQKMESIGSLAGGVAHDFNNMLGVILGHTELALLQTDEDNDLVSDLNEIQKAATRSADITKQLLAFARKQTISPRQLDLNDTVESMLNMLRRLIGEDIDLVWEPAAHLWPVKMDPTQIDQILANLCVNARDAIAGVGKLTIETGRKSFDEEYCKQHVGFIPGDFVLMAVSDNGSGMDKDTLVNLFEPFFTTKDVGQGTGLGLATIYGIVKQNNGFINVYSEPGNGSTFKIYLPRLVADEEADKAVPEKKEAAGGTETILLVEDEASILRMTRMMLERKGYIVLSAATPAEAMEKAKTHSGAISLLMTDVVMPEMNGRDLSGKIAELYPGIRLLFMSGYTADVIAHQGVLDDGVAFIQKPFSMADMAMKVRQILDMTPDKNQA